MKIILDTETTGLSPLIDEILQLSIISDDGSRLFDSLFRPSYHTSWDEASKINRIWPEHVSFCDTIRTQLPRIQKIIDKADAIIGYNVSFDLQFLRASGIIPPSGCDFIDVMQLYQDYMGVSRWVKLTDAAEHFGFVWPPAGAHNSLSDCYATLHVYNALCSLKSV